MIATKKLPSQKKLKELFDYDGKNLIWKTDRGTNSVKGQVAGLVPSHGYRIIKIGGVGFKAHRLIWKLHYNTEPDGIDHINHISDDNRLENLRAATQSVNNKNASIRRDNQSGFTGVVRKKNRWAADIFVDGKHHYLGSFKTIEEAIGMRITANDHFGFHINHGGKTC